TPTALIVLATEALPLELHRNYTLIRQLDESAEDLMSTVKDECGKLTSCTKKLSRDKRLERLRNISNLLNETVKRGEEKFALAKSTYDTVCTTLPIDRHCTRLDNDLQKFEDEQLIGPGRPSSVQAAAISEEVNEALDGKSRSWDWERMKPCSHFGKLNCSTGHNYDTFANHFKLERKGQVDGAIIRASLTPRNDHKISKDYQAAGSAGRKRGRKPKTRVEEDTTTAFAFGNSADNAQVAVAISEMPVDPNEPVYCFCRQVSYGEMVACDNDECEIEWFHLPCVKLTTVPRGKWYCDNCAPLMQSKLKKL
ncbi:hypothetical protein INT43_007911, partial [Umbelopsis isabellina]